MKKYTFLIFISFAMLLILNSFLISKFSKGHQYAASTIYLSKQVEFYVGSVKNVLLLGSSYSDDSITVCRTLNYLIIGANKNIYLEVSVETIDTKKQLWQISKMRRGYFEKELIYEIPKHKVKCRL